MRFLPPEDVAPETYWQILGLRAQVQKPCSGGGRRSPYAHPYSAFTVSARLQQLQAAVRVKKGQVVEKPAGNQQGSRCAQSALRRGRHQGGNGLRALWVLGASYTQALCLEAVLPAGAPSRSCLFWFRCPGTRVPAAAGRPGVHGDQPPAGVQGQPRSPSAPSSRRLLRHSLSVWAFGGF